MNPVRGNLVVVIPAKNEAATIASVVTAAVRRGLAVLVVDDGSTDGTGPAAKAAGAWVLRKEASQGYDPAIADGLNQAFRDGAGAAVTCDADGQHRLEDLVRVAEPVLAGKADLAAGVRDHYNRAIERAVGWYARRLLGTRDPFCGLKCYSQSFHRACGPFPQALNVGSLPLAWARNRGLRTCFLPIQCPRRLDRPRFGPLWHASVRLARAFLATLRACSRPNRKNS